MRPARRRKVLVGSKPRTIARAAVIALRAGINGALSGMAAAASRLLDSVVIIGKVRLLPPRRRCLAACPYSGELSQGPAALQKVGAAQLVVPSLAGVDEVVSDVAQGWAERGKSMAAVVRPRLAAMERAHPLK